MVKSAFVTKNFLDQLLDHYIKVAARVEEAFARGGEVIDALQGKLDELKKVNDDLEGSLQESETEIADLKSRLKNLETENADLKGKFQGSDAVNTDLKGRLGTSETANGDLKGRLQKYEALGPVTSDSLLVSRHEIERLKDLEHSTQAERGRDKETIARLQSRLDESELANQDLKLEVAGKKGSSMQETSLSTQAESTNGVPYGLRSEHEKASEPESKAFQSVSDQPNVNDTEQPSLKAVDSAPTPPESVNTPEKPSSEDFDLVSTLQQSDSNLEPLPSKMVHDQGHTSQQSVGNLENSSLEVVSQASFAVKHSEDSELDTKQIEHMCTPSAEKEVFGPVQDSDSEDKDAGGEQDESKDKGGAIDSPDDDDEDGDDHSTGGTGSIVSQLPKDSAEDDRGSSENETSHSSPSEEVNSSIETESDVGSVSTIFTLDDDKTDPRFHTFRPTTSAESQSKENTGDPVEKDSDSSTAAEAENADGSQESGPEDDKIEGDGEDSPPDHVETDLPDDSTAAEAENADGSQESASEEDDIEGEGVVDGEGQGQRKRTRRGGKKRKNPVKRQQAREAQEEQRVKQAQREQRVQQAQQEERQGDQSVQQAEEAQELFTGTSTVIVKLPAGIYPPPERPEDEQSAQHQQPRQELQEVGQSVQRVQAAQNLVLRPPGSLRVCLPPNPPRRTLPGLGASRWASAIPTGPAAMSTGRVIPAGLKYMPPKGPRGGS